MQAIYGKSTKIVILTNVTKITKTHVQLKKHSKGTKQKFLAPNKTHKNYARVMTH